MMTDAQLAEIRARIVPATIDEPEGGAPILVFYRGSSHDAAVDIRALLAEVERLRAKYETAPTACGRGHSNNLPMALWDCPTCHEQLVKAARSVIAAEPAYHDASVDTLRKLVTP